MTDYREHAFHLLREWPELGSALKASFSSELEQQLFYRCLQPGAATLDRLPVTQLMDENLRQRMVLPMQDFIARAFAYRALNLSLVVLNLSEEEIKRQREDTKRFEQGMLKLQDCIAYAMLAPLILQLEPKQGVVTNTAWPYAEERRLGLEIIEKVSASVQARVGEADPNHPRLMQARARLVRTKAAP